MTIFLSRILTSTMALFLFSATGVVVAEVTIRGAVYNDVNKNGQRDSGETGMSGIQVSDGDQIVHTDGEGHYALETTADIPNTVFVIDPNGFSQITQMMRGIF